ncbi:MAG: hypothetical protein MJ211_13210 [Bacteroidales bacterium]|nr:hypothetical protein [Bacteroidales bacterium]
MYDLIKLSKDINETELKNVVSNNVFNVSYDARGDPQKYTTLKNNPLYIAIIKDNCNKWKIEIKVSLAKFYNNYIYKIWINTTPFNYNEALHAFYLLMQSINIDLYTANVKYYEIGLNLYTKFEPSKYIAKMQRVKNQLFDKVLIDDSYNYTFERTTTRGKNIRTIFKIYDKTHEQKERKHEKIKNTLRIELIRKRPPKLTLKQLIDIKQVSYDIDIFLKAFSNISFEKLILSNGLKNSQIENIKEIINIGCNSFIEKYKEKYHNNEISLKQYRTKIKFVNDWNNGNYKNIQVIQTEFEKEFNTLLINEIQKICPYGQSP